MWLRKSYLGFYFVLIKKKKHFALVEIFYSIFILR